MLLILHISLALGSLALASFMLFKPKKTSFTASYGLVGGTILSGTYLVLSTHANLIQACFTGLLYLGIVFSLLAVAKYRLQSVPIKNQRSTKD